MKIPYLNIKTLQVRYLDSTVEPPEEYQIIKTLYEKHLKMSQQAKKRGFCGTHNYNQGKDNPMFGREQSEEQRQSIGRAVSKQLKGRHWYNNGFDEVLSLECPENYKRGRLTK